MKEGIWQDNHKGRSRGSFLLEQLCGAGSGEGHAGRNIHWGSSHERESYSWEKRAVTEVGSKCRKAKRTLKITMRY